MYQALGAYIRPYKALMSFKMWLNSQVD